MKTMVTLFAGLLLFAGTLSAQQERKITIEKTTVGPDGSIKTETIVKTGDDARDFELDDYLEANSNESVVIIVEKANGQKQYIRTSPNELEDDLYFNGEMQAQLKIAQEEAQRALEEVWKEMENVHVEIHEGRLEAQEAYEEAMDAMQQAMNRGFLGVSPAGDDDEDKPGVAVNIVSNSGAEKAGLEHGAVILQLDAEKINAWVDIERFMKNTSPGQKIKIKYRKAGDRNTSTTTAVLTSKSNNAPDWRTIVEQHEEGWADVTIDERSKEACLGVYSDQHDQGAEITDFTSTSAARSAGMEVGDVIVGVNGATVKNHEELWMEIAQYKPGESVTIDFLRDGNRQSLSTTLNPCDAQKQIILRSQDDGGEEELGRMYIWDWTKENQDRLRTSQVITIPRAGDGDTPVNSSLNDPVPTERKLNIRNFKAQPGPDGGPVSISFNAPPSATVVTLYDAAGRQIFREELNSFSGGYQQAFDMSAHANTTITVHIQQGDMVFIEKVTVGV